MAGLEGSTLDRYELRKLVGKGGMAEVYQGYDNKFQRVVAVKVFKRTDEEMLRRFIREARLMASFRHPHLVPVYDAGEYILDGYTQYYIVMPFMDGGTLRARLKPNPLTPVEACRYLSDIADALDYVHSKGIIHRDIKASNVLLDKEGNCFLADFGIARATSDATHLTSTGNVLGTVDYVAPELFEVNRKADALSDLYSLGVLLYEMVTGQLPFSAENQIALVSMHINQPPPPPSKLSRNVSPSVERVIYKALAKKPELRYQSATELAQAFCQAASAPADAVVPPSRVSRDALWEYSPSGPNLSNSGQRGPLILPPPITPASVPSQARSIPNTPAPPVVPVQGYPPSGRPPVAPPTAYQQPAMYPPHPPQAPPAPPASRRGLLLGIAGIAILLLIAVPLVVAYNHYAPSGGGANPTQTTTAGTVSGSTVTVGTTVTPNQTATAQASATAAAANQTATAVASATATVATAIANATATPGVFGTAIANPSYSDSLKDANSATTQAANWDQGDNCRFVKGNGYHVLASKVVNQFQACRETAKHFSNVAISVDMVILKGDSGGLFFRVDQNAGCCNGYLFEIDRLGRYKLSLSGSTVIQDWTAASAIRQNKQLNTLQVLAQGTSISLYVNNTFLKTFTDSTFTNGDIGFSADSLDVTQDAEMVFSNLKVSPQQ